MSKKDGKLFSRAFFGYKRSDVNNYIKQSDVSFNDQLTLLRSENERLLERALNAEAKAAELEGELKSMKAEGRQVASESRKGADPAAAKSESRPVKHDISRPLPQKRTNIFGTVRKK